MIALLLCTLPLAAQQSDPAPYTLHVFTNLMEVPALVLGLNTRQKQHLDASSFSIRLDSGPAFAPSYVRIEGDDPISLSILLDLSDTSKDIVRSLRESIPNLALTSLRPKDHVTIYALDCALIHSTEDLPASRQNLTTTLDAILDSPDLHGPKKKLSSCGTHVRLWNSLAVVAERLATLPGRRIVLSITTGYDTESAFRWPQIERYATSRGISLFALDSDLFGPTEYGAERANLQRLCNSTGGIVVGASSQEDIVKNLPHIFDLIRGRYIIQFQRPSNATEGVHNIDVSIKHTSAVIYLTGTTVPMPTTEESTGPDGLPLNPTTSVLGTRRPLVPH